MSTSPSVLTCEGVVMPVSSSSALCIDRLDMGKFAVCIEEESGTLHALAELDSFRDALDARRALFLIVSVLFPTDGHPSLDGEV